MCNYYRKFRKDYSKLTPIFKHLLSSNGNGAKMMKKHLTYLKNKFLNSIIFHHPDSGKRFYINCAASNLRLGTKLYQQDDEGNNLVISRVLNSSERNYNVTEKELLCVVFTCNKFRMYILGYPLTVRSDHKSIPFLQKSKLSHGRLTRWILALQENNITWEYLSLIHI